MEGAEGGRCALRILDLGGNAIGVAGIEALRGALGRNQTLHTLGLADARLGEEGGIEIAGVVEGNAQLQRLDLRRNALQVVGCEGSSGGRGCSRCNTVGCGALSGSC